ncbi:MAG: histidine phosphatase family protein [Deltaproteobacteria bacterium]|nr:histidine phosphatase family protein [Deltaproteobacteria bacterium]
MELVLIRHALPLRVEGVSGTPADPALSEQGRLQVERLQRWLEGERIDAIYASPLRRAQETAAPLAAERGLEIVVEPGIAEFDRDSESYVPLEELKAENRAHWKELVDGGMYASLDIDAFRRTVVEAVERIVAAHARQRVALVCHGGVINAWAAHVLGVERPVFFEPGYTSLHRFLAASSGERSVLSLNEVAHLR